jgi:hypoxanthine phosphoribosyltransferase
VAKERAVVGGELVISAPDIATRVRTLGRQISAEAGPDLLVVAILKGAFVFAADLVRTITLPLEVDFIRVASYGSGTCATGEIRLTKDLEGSVVGRRLLLVEDIVDTGRTLAWLHEHLRERGAAAIKTCVLIDKRERRLAEVVIDYYGFQLQDGFLVGYGLDYAEQYRQLPGIYRLTAGCT